MAQSTVAAWTVAGTENDGAVHAWVPSWTPASLNALRHHVLAAGWRVHLVDNLDNHPNRRDVERRGGVDPLAPEADSRRTVRNLSLLTEDLFFERRHVGPRWQPLTRVLLAVGPGYDGHDTNLHAIASLGRTVGIHLAVSTHLADVARTPDEFRDHITGRWNAELSEHVGRARSALTAVSGCSARRMS